MKITKFGHCCLLVEEKDLRILTDPDTYSTGQEDMKNIDIILITHEHSDHIHIPSLKKCLHNNAKAKIFTNKGVSKLLETENIKHELLEDGNSITVKDVLIEAIGHDHAPLYKTTPCVNTGYFIANKLFYPGDALTQPHKNVEILALPVAGPWLKLSETIDYALTIKPRLAFPVHDGILKQIGITNKIPPTILEPNGIKFIILEENKETEL